MAIDTTQETVFTLTEATKLLPRRRRNKRPSLATLYRWTNEGVRGIRLEFTCVGGTRCTSRQALQRFFDRLTDQAQGTAKTPPAPKPDRAPAVRRAEKVLDGAGI